MAKKPAQHRQPWTRAKIKQVRTLAKGNTPTGLIAYKTKRTENAIRGIAARKNISLKPPNRSPYSRRKG